MAAAAATGGYDDGDRRASSRVIRLAAGGEVWRGGPAGTPVHRSGAIRLAPPSYRRAAAAGVRWTQSGVARYMGYYLGYYMGYYMGYGGPVGVSGWGGPAGTPVCCRRWERCFALRLDDSSTLPATTWAFDGHGLLLG